ncbi:MAG: NADH-quinone oxidoreductase subunit NuoN [Betaproteobacteria bacterium]|nr:NADH-quinone oxidoreductase subunit NuoN [Betaproteobacteria bacterium]
MEFMIPDFRPAMPELFMAAMIVLILLVTTFIKDKRRSVVFWLCQFTLLASIYLLFQVDQEYRAVDTHVLLGLTFSGMYVIDSFGSLLKGFVCLAVAVTLQYGRVYMAERKLDSPEYYLMVLCCALGMMILISASHFVTMYLGLELMSLSLYGLVAINRDNIGSTEAGMKYFVLGALASGLLLYGMSMLYGATGSMQIHQIARTLYEHGAQDVVVIFGLVFVLVGVAFKLGVVPFHMWVPDVYQGAPTAVTVLISSAPKLAAFAMAFRVLVNGLFDLVEQWQQMLMLLAAASIILGNLAAIAQSNIKRMLAYSGISHMGFVLLGLLSGYIRERGLEVDAINAYSSALFYSIAYLMMTLASFGMVILLSRNGFEAENIEDFKGLNQRSPWFAGMMMIVMFSMAGIPFFIGFFAKLSVLQAVVMAGYFKLAVLAVVMSVIGAFYYLRVVKVMYFDESSDPMPLKATLGFKAVLSINILAIAFFGLRSNDLMQICALALRF